MMKIRGSFRIPYKPSMMKIRGSFRIPYKPSMMKIRGSNSSRTSKRRIGKGKAVFTSLAFFLFTFLVFWLKKIFIFSKGDG